MNRTLKSNTQINQNNLLKESANLVGMGINFQDVKDYSNAKLSIQQGIEKIKKVLINDSSANKEMIFEYYSLFDKFLQNVNYDEENDKISEDFKSTFNQTGPIKFIEGNTLKDVYLNYISSKKSIEDIDFLLLPIKLLQKFGESMEIGIYFTKSFYIRKEIWYQTNGKIECLHQKYESYSAIFEKIDNLMILSKNNVINIENIDKFCDMLIDIQNNFSKELTFIKPCKFALKNEIGQSGFYKRFSEISNKLRNNLLSVKMSTKPDYIENIIKMIYKTKDLEIIFTNKNLKKDEEILRERKILISTFFYSVVFKLVLQDLRDLSLRFLKKKLNSFETK